MCDCDDGPYLSDGPSYLDLMDKDKIRRAAIDPKIQAMLAFEQVDQPHTEEVNGSDQQHGS